MKINIMDKTGNIIEQVIKSQDVVVVGIGFLFILIAIVVGVFKQTWLIAGSSLTSLTYQDDEAVDHVATFVGLFIGLVGGISILDVFIRPYFNIWDYFDNSIAGMLFMLSAFFIAFLCFITIVLIRTKKR